VEVRKTTNQMVMQEEHKIYPGLGHELRNTLRPASSWIVLMRDEIF
jgi:transketolase C-terminal domain/subunit